MMMMIIIIIIIIIIITIINCYIFDIVNDLKCLDHIHL